MDTPFEHSTITVVPLGTTFIHAPLISDSLLQYLQNGKVTHKKSLLLYNRRGSGRAWICQDCGYFPNCPHCDIALAYHTSPLKKLICHQCNFIEELSLSCVKCSWNHFQPVGIGIQRIEYDLSVFLPGVKIIRMDSDVWLKKTEILASLKSADIIIGTHASIGVLHGMIDQIIFLQLEADLTLPDFRVEEDIYHIVDYAKKSGKDIMIQTYTPDHQLLSVITWWNYRDFLTYMSSERKTFLYPPYAQFAMIRIHDINQERVKDIVAKLVNKITLIKEETVFMAYDLDIWEKYAGEWVQKIILKWKDISGILHELKVEITRNRAVTLERR